MQISDIEENEMIEWHPIIFWIDAIIKCSWWQMDSKANLDCSSFVMWLLLALPLLREFVFAVATNSTNEENKAGGMRH
jgi:hypothetical protein